MPDAAMRPRSVIDVLAQMPDDELATLRGKNQRQLAHAVTELARLEHERQQLEEALKRVK